jgi:hypothetical protein
MARVGMIEIPVSGLAGERPQAIPGRGERRLVKLVETPLGFGHVLWTSPYVVEDPDLKEPCRKCVVLVGKGPPRPEPVVMTMPVSYLEACSEDAVEW